jgi:2-hydroxy-3-keto-5-methylthiopentenyl-1-phosphate phosphatase
MKKIIYAILLWVAMVFSQPLKVAFIGDSISLELKPYLKREIPDIYVNGRVGRQFYSVFNVLKRININDYNVFVIELGTNGYVKPKDLNRLINLLHNKKIYLCTIELPDRYIWKHEVNNLYFKTSKEYPNVKVIDWYNFSKNHPQFFIGDGVHLTRLGAKEYAKLVVDKVLK